MSCSENWTFLKLRNCISKAHPVVTALCDGRKYVLLLLFAHCCILAVSQHCACSGATKDACPSAHVELCGLLCPGPRRCVGSNVSVFSFT